VLSVVICAGVHVIKHYRIIMFWATKVMQSLGSFTI